ncbi:MAG: adenine nucleotide alpha hydrolase [Alistipes sp.]|nr:adenine nucleotide alpha hydrolase [Alistipes sp.]
MAVRGKFKAVFNWSGGKDSALALYEILRSGEYEVLSLLTTVESGSGQSPLHQIPEKILRDQAASIGLPIYIARMDPQGDNGQYESAMREAVDHFRAQGATHFIFGDIFLSDIRSYRESRLAPYGIEVVEPLWGIPTGELIERFIDSGLQTVIVAATAGILGREFIGRKIDRSFVDSLPAGCDPCGENGEYHTLCYDGPIFRYPVGYKLDRPRLIHHVLSTGDSTSCIGIYRCGITPGSSVQQAV